MNFSERIYELRSKAGFSQGELADRLDVSRQAVSKWENNSAVPELDKLLKMSELFSVSLDELVKGTRTQEKAGERLKKGEPSVEARMFLPSRKIAALILFGMAFFSGLVFLLVGGIFGLLYIVPFIVFGLICWFCEKHVGIKCLWAALFMTNTFCGWATGISVSAVLYTFSWTDKMNYLTLAFSWGLLAFNVFTVIYTAVKLGNEAPKKSEKLKKNLIISVSSSAVVGLANVIIRVFLKRLYENTFDDMNYMQVISFAVSILAVVRQYVFEIVVTFALIAAIRYIKSRKQQKNTDV